MRLIMVLLLFQWPLVAARADIAVSDDAGRQVQLAGPARRIVSLAPHITELLFAAGAGDAVVGVTEFSDYPETARAITRVGGGTGLDLEAIRLVFVAAPEPHGGGLQGSQEGEQEGERK